MKFLPLTILLYILTTFQIHSQNLDGYKLWLRYNLIENSEILRSYSKLGNPAYLSQGSEIMQNAKNELSVALGQMLGKSPTFSNSIGPDNALVVALAQDLPKDLAQKFNDDLSNLNNEGFLLKSVNYKNNRITIVTAKKELGILYGVFRLLNLMQSNQDLNALDLLDSPKIKIRMLNHWDNLDRTVERGYAGFSLWDWQKLPEYIDQRYIDYARANASIGINATALTNVNANALVLTPMYLKKVQALAEVFRGYGIKVYLTARFSAPIEIGNLKTADPLDKEVKKWWKDKTSEIYKIIPDFGGFLVKANSEGQPGPQNYGRDHVDGANMMAEALEPFGGNVIWRAFVYSEHEETDRAKQAYDEFVPYDGKFKDNVLVQVKNGAIDFQPREPFHPMFGAMPKTPLMMEFQITQEYLGFSTHLVYLPKLFEEVLEADTFKKGKGSTVAKVISGSLHGNKLTGMAGVANIGTDINWTGHPFAQANWYGFGRLAWNPELSSEIIAEEWLRATYSNDKGFLEPIKEMMLTSREAVVNYMNPLGLHHLFDTGHHYGPGPWVDDLGRPDWNPVYYHKADSKGIGFDRTPTGSNATEQYAEEVAKLFNDPNRIPEEYLLWFHHLPWNYQLRNGKTLWDGLALKYQQGVDQVRGMITTWANVRPYLTEGEFNEVNMLLQIQLKEAKWWRDASLLYFQTFSQKSLPDGVENPVETLEYFKSLKFPFAPGIRPRWD
ncbi:MULTISPECIES: alpha-glucuronidase family glycosyl hydrolase [Arenibacter]|uniref:alpha-glucuronidase family glycosyl hydrolase n=1 Tax=Arenibacter TaxID=178469 RepID=UPI0004DFB2AA|nr:MULTISPECIES: alpha-glucuronidase family glycosyl hydrolase [Arenibacter]GBF20454.1 extracellular xylan exo-alpha-(1->2)-glucuronosidase precursor [Arenibacter sp. NBRC 103722]